MKVVMVVADTTMGTAVLGVTLIFGESLLSTTVEISGKLLATVGSAENEGTSRVVASDGDGSGDDDSRANFLGVGYTSTILPREGMNRERELF